jgi:iron complex transport system substrate-binding protein
VGGYHDPNFEAIVRLRPDLVVMLVEHRWLLPALGKLGLTSLVVNHQTIDGVLESLPLLGEASGPVELEEALRIRDAMVGRLGRVRDKTAGLARPRVMFSIDRVLGTGGLESVYIAGPDGFFETMIELAGGQNAFQGKGVRFPVVSSEGILRMDPEVIIDMVAGMTHARPDEKTLKADWQQVAQVDAVRNGRVYVVEEPYAFVPGPRVVLLVERLARLIHPEVDWQP